MKAADDFVTAEGSHYATVNREQQEGQAEGDDHVDHGRGGEDTDRAPARLARPAGTPGRC